jgi:hypothetical protein
MRAPDADVSNKPAKRYLRKNSFLSSNRKFKAKVEERLPVNIPKRIFPKHVKVLMIGCDVGDGTDFLHHVN